jgi:hypothetical protein
MAVGTIQMSWKKPTMVIYGCQALAVALDLALDLAARIATRGVNITS